MSDEQEICIVFDEKIVGAWYLKTLPDQDWLCGLRELIPEEKYEITYRFRYYKDDKIFESKDKRSWYRMTVDGTRAYCTLTLRAMGEKMAQAARCLLAPGEANYTQIGHLFECLNNNDYDDFSRRWADMPFVYMRAAEGKVKP